jgi:asparagine synthase (glutamine-hydrolysing)
MCGLAGFISRTSPADDQAMAAVAVRMTGAIAHRGPDDEGVWTDAAAGIALGHRRLSIIDLSAEGHQPMHSAGGAFVLVFNGEIYNFQEIRSDLERHGHRFRGHSDTEVMLAAFEQWGVRRSVERFNGMFSFAVWDRRSRSLHLCRDRLGKKPLYYGWAGKTLLFASELKALHAHPAFQARIHRNVIPLYLRHGYIPAPYSIYEGIYKLPAAGLLTIREGDAGSNAPPDVYWSVIDAARRSLAASISSESAAFEELESLLLNAVRIRMLADVPLGAFLSGGIDSSLVVAMMQSVSPIPVRTFSIGFNEASWNEAHHAEAVARHLGCEHTELYVTPDDALHVIPGLQDISDEPFADVSMIPTLLLSKLTRASVTVALSGDGGDELFGGYTAYDSCARYFERNRRWPPALRRITADCVVRMPAHLLNAALGTMKVRNAGGRLHRTASVLAQTSPGVAYRAMLSHWEFPEAVAIGASEPGTAYADDTYAEVAGGEVPLMMLLDAAVYLPDDILVKVDRASMAVSLESRCPLLDYRLFELAWKLPLSLKRRNGTGKWILKQLAYRRVPQELLDRPKTGFDIPTAEWLRGPLRQWGEDLLDPARLRRQGYLHPSPVRKAWAAHQSGEADNSQRLWNVLMFQEWLETYSRRTRSLERRELAS